jgi:hypothetical protein
MMAVEVIRAAFLEPPAWNCYAANEFMKRIFENIFAALKNKRLSI